MVGQRKARAGQLPSPAVDDLPWSLWTQKASQGRQHPFSSNHFFILQVIGFAVRLLFRTSSCDRERQERHVLLFPVYQSAESPAISSVGLGRAPQEMVRERKSRSRKSIGPVSTPQNTAIEAEKPVENGKKHLNGEVRNGKKISESEKELSRPLGDREKEPTTAKSETKAAQKNKSSGGSQCVLLTQGIMANDHVKIDSVIRNLNNEIINATLRDLQPMQVLPLLKIIESRLKTRNAADIRPTIRWAQVAFSVHMPYLSSLPNLEKEIGGLMGWLRARVGHHRELMSLHGKISTIADLIKRRTNNVVIVQQPLVVFNNDVDSDSEDFDTIASDDDGESSEDDWWEDNELKDENQEDGEDDGASDDDDDDDSEMDADSAGSGGSGSENDDNESDEDMEHPPHPHIKISQIAEESIGNPLWSLEIHQESLMRNGLAPAPNIPNPRNAGRKKSNPVWEFFTDLRAHGLAGVRCRFCHWVTNDRSPTTMKFHLKRKHDTGPGGLWAICEEKINSQAPANYAPRVKKQPEDLLLKALTHSSPFPFNPFATAEIKLGAQDDFLAALIQQASQYANASTSPSANSNEGNASNENESLTSDSVFLSKLNSTYQSCKEEDSSSSSVSGSTSTSASSDFQLSDGSSIATLLQIATDSDLVFTFNARKLGEYCFESNAKNHKMVTLTDCGHEIRVSQLDSDEEIRVEMWRKSDWQQFTWAVRGTCLHFLKNEMPPPPSTAELFKLAADPPELSDT
ncbi:unnamed protein product [Caenorhabditis sp. 36 PRJEB53466]|nr:unnamed protein product [Caenorhabditis sp. 36 PRJEB53466]